MIPKTMPNSHEWNEWAEKHPLTAYILFTKDSEEEKKEWIKKYLEERK